MTVILVYLLLQLLPVVLFQFAPHDLAYLREVVLSQRVYLAQPFRHHLLALPFPYLHVCLVPPQIKRYHEQHLLLLLLPVQKRWRVYALLPQLLVVLPDWLVLTEFFFLLVLFGPSSHPVNGLVVAFNMFVLAGRSRPSPVVGFRFEGAVL